MTEIIEANFHIEFLTVLRVLFQGVLQYFDYRKTREALVVSNQELARTKAELETCQMSTRFIVVLGLVMFLLMFIATKRG